MVEGWGNDPQEATNITISKLSLTNAISASGDGIPGWLMASPGHPEMNAPYRLHNWKFKEPNHDIKRLSLPSSGMYPLFQSRKRIPPGSAGISLRQYRLYRHYHADIAQPWRKKTLVVITNTPKWPRRWNYPECGNLLHLNPWQNSKAWLPRLESTEIQCKRQMLTMIDLFRFGE